MYARGVIRRIKARIQHTAEERAVAHQAARHVVVRNRRSITIKLRKLAVGPVELGSNSGVGEVIEVGECRRTTVQKRIENIPARAMERVLINRQLEGFARWRIVSKCS